jgi:hypothetical protein
MDCLTEKNMHYELGQKIRVESTLTRKSKFVKESDLSPYKYEVKFWDETKLRNPVDGIVVGIRSLSNGRNHYIPEYGNDYEPKEHFRALIVAYHLSRKPLLVKINPHS